MCTSQLTSRISSIYQLVLADQRLTEVHMRRGPRGVNHLRWRLLHKTEMNMIRKQCIFWMYLKCQEVEISHTQIHRLLFSALKQAFFRGIGSEVSSVRTWRYLQDKSIKTPIHQWVRTGGTRNHHQLAPNQLCLTRCYFFWLCDSASSSAKTVEVMSISKALLSWTNNHITDLKRDAFRIRSPEPWVSNCI